ncbi:hypothetical protein ACI7ZP_001711 [Neisseria gonorrhoeae]|uniref:hypothetical protein n=1 Tax=Neisseria gonorrhoeae TaxID=485 RepID=UPI000A7EDFEA
MRERIAQLEKGAEKPGVETADGSDNSLFGDFSDEDVKKGVEKLIQEKLAGYEADMKRQEAAGGGKGALPRNLYGAPRCGFDCGKPRAGGVAGCAEPACPQGV